MSYAAAFPVVAACLIGSASLPQRASAQSNPYALDRLFLMPSENQPLHKVLSFNDETKVANYYGATSYQAKMATEFFAGYNGDSAHMLFTRYPELSARAHLYGGNITNLTELQAINGSLSITSQGYNFSGSVDLSGVTSFDAAAIAIQNALDKKLPPAADTTGSSIAAVSVPFTGSIHGLLMDAAAPPGSIKIGSYITGLGVPQGTQVTGQVKGTLGGDGVYGLFVPEGHVSTEVLTETYGVLTVGSTSFGRVKVGQQVTGDGILPYTSIEDHLSGSGAGSMWLVNRAPATAPIEDMNMTGAPLSVFYYAVAGATKDRGYFLIQQNGAVNYASSSLSYATGTAAKFLRLTKRSRAFDSTPGQIVKSPSAWMDHFIETESDKFSSFQAGFPLR